ncbi:MAG: hypothetical protein HMLKMBBP_02492 [Planctomycetes bacterium]|nr:hypothetical protein [Planctomycetota bacterium]
MLGESGAPLRGVRVAVLRADAAPGSPPEAIFDTDADGRVRTRALRDGSWSVELTPPAAGGARTPLGTVRNGAPAELRAPR